MNTETNNQEEVVVDSPINEGEGEQAVVQEETIALPKSEYEKLNQTLGSLKREVKELKKPKEVVETPQKTNTGELDETQLDYLDVKGINDSDDIEIIQRVVKRTGMTVREALKDEYVVGKLAANKAEREVKAATPSSTKRAAQSVDNSFDLAYAKYERTGELPTDFSLRTKIVNAKIAKLDPNKPYWH